VKRPRKATEEQIELEDENRDLRPAVFIKDIQRRSKALEEEKQQHFLRLKKSSSQKEKVAKSDSLGGVHDQIQNLEVAIAQLDQGDLKKSVNEAKLVQLESKDDHYAQRLADLISKAESKLSEKPVSTQQV